MHRTSAMNAGSPHLPTRFGHSFSALGFGLSLCQHSWTSTLTPDLCSLGLCSGRFLGALKRCYVVFQVFQSHEMYNTDDIYDMMYVYDKYIYIYPPTPALAKAGAAPGTTEGVEPCVLPPARKTPVQPRHSTFSSHGILLFRASGVPFGSVHRVQFQQVPEAVPVSFYGASRLPFASPQTRLQLDYRPNATPATAISPRQTLCTSKQSLRPCQCHFIALQGCRLPSLKRACS